MCEGMWTSAWIGVATSLIFLSAGQGTDLHQRLKRETVTVLVDSQAVTSPNWPGYYPPNFNGNTYVNFGNHPECADGQCMVFLAYQYSIENAAGCVYDRMIIDIGAPSQRVLCGKGYGTYGPVAVISNKSIPIRFTSDQSVQDLGFRVDYNITKEVVVTTQAPDGRAIGGINPKNGCNVEVWTNSGRFQSPNYPSNYPTLQNCYYIAHFTSPGPHQVRVEVTYDIEEVKNCLFDYLEWSGSSKSRVCGTSLDSVFVETIQVTDSQLKVHFHSDNGINGKGFSLVYSVL